jgi:hypothetical protein
MTVICTALEPGMAASQLPRLMPLITAGYAYGDQFPPADFGDLVRNGKILIWVAIDDVTGEVLTAVTTELVPMISGLACWIGQCSGRRMREWIHFHLKIEEYARAEGCVKTILRGRGGWGGVMDGYKVKSVTLEKVL